jgi:nitroreductase
VPNEVYEAVRTVLAVREYGDREIPDEVLRRIVDAGRLTASARNAQPWHFVVVRERENLRKLGSLVRTGPYTAAAAAAIIVVCDKNPYAMSDASRAIQSMILVAWAEGVGSNWTGFGGIEGVRKEFGIPEDLDVLAVMPLGYPKRRVIGRKKRKALDDVVSGERFGSPLGGREHG